MMDTLKLTMIRDMEICGFAKNTISNYSIAISHFCDWMQTDPKVASLDDIARFQEYLMKVRKYSWSSLNIHVCALRFLYNKTLRQEYIIDYIPFQKRPKKLPVVLS